MVHFIDENLKGGFNSKFHILHDFISLSKFRRYNENDLHLMSQNELSKKFKQKFLGLSNLLYIDGVFELSDVIVSDNWGLIQSSNTKLSPNLIDGFGWNLDHINHLASKNILIKEKSSREYSYKSDQLHQTNLTGTAVLVSFPGALTYGHWIFDIVGRVIIFRETMGFEPDYYLFPAPWQRWMERFRVLLGIDKEKIVFLDKKTSYKIKRLYVPTVPSQAPGGVVSKYVMGKIFSAFNDIYNEWIKRENETNGNQVLFLSHTALTSSKDRELSTFDQLENSLNKVGVNLEIVDPMKVSQAELVHSISKSNLCIGQDSSALHNTIMCPKDIIVLQTEKRENLLHLNIQASGSKSFSVLDCKKIDKKWVLPEDDILETLDIHFSK